MKCLYAIPPGGTREALSLCDAYSTSLEALSSNAVALADDLRAFADATGAAALKLDDEDWVDARQALEAHGEDLLAGDIFWSHEAAGRAQRALDAASESSPCRALASWLAGQVQRDRAVVLLAS